MNIAIFVLLIIFVFGPIGRAVAHRISKGGAVPIAPEAEEVRQLREQVADLTVRLAELSENQEFTTRLLEDRSSAASDFTEDTGK
ncbi:MAG: hypothetical protein ABFS14_11885 [Gemmatimonadota bacterium]